MCSPSRASFMTARYPIHTGIVDWIPPGSAYGLPLNETTMLRVFSDGGYKVRCVGKWHLVRCEPSMLDGNKLSEFFRASTRRSLRLHLEAVTRSSDFIRVVKTILRIYLTMRTTFGKMINPTVGKGAPRFTLMLRGSIQLLFLQKRLFPP